jgi:hypothetical protein
VAPPHDGWRLLLSNAVLTNALPRHSGRRPGVQAPGGRRSGSSISSSSCSRHLPGLWLGLWWRLGRLRNTALTGRGANGGNAMHMAQGPSAGTWFWCQDGNSIAHQPIGGSPEAVRPGACTRPPVAGCGTTAVPDTKWCLHRGELLREVSIVASSCMALTPSHSCRTPASLGNHEPNLRVCQVSQVRSHICANSTLCYNKYFTCLPWDDTVMLWTPVQLATQGCLHEARGTHAVHAAVTQRGGEDAACLSRYAVAAVRGHYTLALDIA